MDQTITIMWLMSLPQGDMFMNEECQRIRKKRVSTGRWAKVDGFLRKRLQLAGLWPPRWPPRYTKRWQVLWPFLFPRSTGQFTTVHGQQNRSMCFSSDLISVPAAKRVCVSMLGPGVPCLCFSSGITPLSWNPSQLPVMLTRCSLN